MNRSIRGHFLAALLHGVQMLTDEGSVIPSSIEEFSLSPTLMIDETSQILEAIKSYAEDYPQGGNEGLMQSIATSAGGKLAP